MSENPMFDELVAEFKARGISYADIVKPILTSVPASPFIRSNPLKPFKGFVPKVQIMDEVPEFQEAMQQYVSSMKRELSETFPLGADLVETRKEADGSMTIVYEGLSPVSRTRRPAWAKSEDEDSTMVLTAIQDVEADEDELLMKPFGDPSKVCPPFTMEIPTPVVSRPIVERPNWLFIDDEDEDEEIEDATGE